LITYWQLSVPSSPEISDGLTNFLWDHGALGVVEEEAPGRPATLRAFFPETAPSAALRQAVITYRDSLGSLGFSVSPAEPEIGPLLDGDWAHAWQQSFPPLEIGTRLLVVPPWEARPPGTAGGRAQLIIEPGRAFGTGHHGSTAGCLELVEHSLLSSPERPPSVLDIGTGTGILAIAALALGARSALAIDVDPDAIAAARLNAEGNGVADRLELALASPTTLPERAPFPLVMANLLAHTHLGLVEPYGRLVAPEGLLVLGGILADEHEVVSGALRAGGFDLVRVLLVEGWASLLMRRLPET